MNKVYENGFNCKPQPCPIERRDWGWVFYFIGLAGLIIMFNSALKLNTEAFYGMLSVLLAVFLQTASAVWVKRIHAQIPANIQVTGGLLFSLPLYLVIWLVSNDTLLPDNLSAINIASILYLGIIATTIGFVLYYYLLLHLSATTVAMIPLLTPVFALILGHTINQEPFTLKIAIGTALILSSLIIHELSNRFNINRKKNK